MEGDGEEKRQAKRGTPIWSAICFKIMTRYSCGFLPRIRAIFPASCFVFFFPQVCGHFLFIRPFHANIHLTNAHIQLFRERLSDNVHATTSKERYCGWF